jgi:excisionase family DNA binding protein
METRLISTGLFAREAAVSAETVRRWIDSGQLPAIRMAGGYRLIERAAADRFLQRRAARREQRAGR